MTQIILALSESINIDVNNDKTTEVSVSSCPNECSNNGICIRSTELCKCNAGFGGIDCSMTTQMLEQRQEIRQKLMEAVLLAVSQNITPPTVNSLLLHVVSTESLTHNPAELSNYTQALAASLTSSFAKQVEHSFSTDIIQGIGAIISNVVKSGMLFSTVDSQFRKTLTTLYDSVFTLIGSILDNKVTGEVPTTIQTSQLSLLAYRNYPSSLCGMKFSSGSEHGNSINFDLPKSFALTNSTASALGQLHEIFVASR